MKFADKLIELDACEDAWEWVGNRELRRAWTECQRSDWMLWLLGEMLGEPGWPDDDDHRLHHNDCDCAEAALRYVPDGKDRPRLAIEAKRAWLRGDITDADLAAAWAAARAAARAAQADIIRKHIPAESLPRVMRRRR